jgi:nucleoside-diphosphate-sugar epimerase
MCEPILHKYADDTFVGAIFRPATVCGHAPRQRLDLSVNILTNHAITNGKIRVFGGSQLRPNLHVQDYCDLCLLLLEAPAEKVQYEVFNCGYQNMSIMDIALMVKRVVEEMMPEKAPIEIATEPTDDIRSYHINSDKIQKALGFAPKHSIEEAVRDLVAAFRENELPQSMDNDWYYNVRTLKKRGAA